MSTFSSDTGLSIGTPSSYQDQGGRTSPIWQEALTRSAMRNLHISGLNIPCYNIPYGLNLRFFGREGRMKNMKTWLDPKEENENMRVVGIHGLGGVGKTQLALQYANTSLKTYDIIIWVPAETRVKVILALSSFATKLGLSSQEGNEDDYQMVQKLRDWLNKFDAPFLLVFDNVEDASSLDQIWPSNTNGSIIITTRSASVASRRAASVLELECFGGDSGSKVLYSLTGKPPATDDDAAAAAEITSLLGGLPLAMAQVSTFITDRNCSYEELLELYKKSAERVLTRSQAPSEYDYTSLTTWNVSLEKLSEKARILQNVLAFFNPDLIQERMILETKAQIDDDRLDSLFDDFDFGDAVMELTRAALVTRISPSKALSVHRLVQLSVFNRLSAEDRIFYFDTVVQILSYDFPNTWNTKGPHQGHGYKAWENTRAVSAHVGWLISLSKEHKVKPDNSTAWAELIFRAGTYLWETEQPTLARSFVEFGLGVSIDRSSAIAAQAYRLMGNILLDLARPRAALEAYSAALSIRQKIQEPESPEIADVYDSIAYSLTEIGDVVQAMKYISKAMSIHHAHDPLKRGRTEAIRALAYLRAKQPQEALEALQTCWELQGLTQDQVEASKYPKHNGDIVLLARIYWMQAEKEKAQELMSKTITIRYEIFDDDDGGPRVADSTFHLARMLQYDEKYRQAAKLLHGILDISGQAQEMRGHLARALWFLSRIEMKLGSPEIECAKLKERAKRERGKIVGREGDEEDTDESFMKLVSWMLW